LPKIEEDGKSWLRRPKLYKGVVEPYKKKNLSNMYKESNQASGCNLITVDWSQMTNVLHHSAKHRISKNKHNAL
jgi:hypothetical protein